MKAQDRIPAAPTLAVESGAAGGPKGLGGVGHGGGGNARPKLLEALKTVMGNESLSPEEILSRLGKRGWAPGASNPRSYLAFTMAANPDVFAAARAKFRVRKPVGLTSAPTRTVQLEAVPAPSTACLSRHPERSRLARASERPDAAEHWRSTLLGLLRATDAPEALHSEIMRGLEARIWVNLTDALGNKFQTFEAFCSEPPPFGLGAAAHQVARVLERLVGPRQADLLTHAPSRQGARAQPPANAGGKSTRQTERLRAVHERAPEPVRRLYAAGVLPLAVAASFGLADPTIAQAAEIQRASMAASALLHNLSEAPSEAELRAVRKKAKALLPGRTSRRGEALLLMNRVRALSASERAAFIELFQAWVGTSEAGWG